MIKINASYRLKVTAAEDEPIAPAESFKDQNKDELKDVQNEVGKQEQSPSKTKASARLFGSR